MKFGFYFSENKCPNRSNSTSVTSVCNLDDSIGSVCLHNCPPGQEVVGSKQSLCRENGEWSHPVPTCQSEYQYVYF